MLHIATCPRITPSCCCSGSSPRSQVKIKSFPLIDKNNVEVTSFINAIFQEIRGEDADSRPLLILVNPNSGSGAAKRRYEAEVAPYFKKMNLATEVLVTTRAGHAKEIGSKIDASKYRGIVTASGDGLLYEVLQGILSRKDDAIATIRKLKLGVLPLGSGNGLAASILKDANESDITDLLSSAFLIARGASRDIDIAAIETSSKSSEVLYSFLCLEWALFADIDIESEWLRCSYIHTHIHCREDWQAMLFHEVPQAPAWIDGRLCGCSLSLSLSLSVCLFKQTNKHTHTHTDTVLVEYDGWRVYTILGSQHNTSIW